MMWSQRRKEGCQSDGINEDIGASTVVLAETLLLKSLVGP